MRGKIYTLCFLRSSICQKSGADASFAKLCGRRARTTALDSHSFDGLFTPEIGPIAALFRTFVSKNLMQSVQNVEMIEEDSSDGAAFLSGVKIAATFPDK
jgi:hypothetical protein